MRKRKPILLLFCLFLFSIGQAQVSKTIHVTTPGTLQSLLTATELSTVTELTVTGSIDARDFLTFRWSKMPNLSKVDINAISIIEYNGEGILYPANELPQNAFYDTFLSLSEVILPNSLTSIGKKAFYWSSLSSVKIPDLVTSIGESAFEVSSNLKSVTFGKSIKYIGKNAFASCGVTSETSIPITLQSIGESAFRGWNISNINLCDSLETIGNSAFSGCRMSSVILPNSVTSVGERAFSRSSTLTSIIIGNKLSSIPNLLFEGSSILSTVTIPNSVISIGNEAFRNCTGLTNFTIPTSITSVGSDAFTNCSELNTLTIPGTIKSVGKKAFSYCSKLTSVNYNASIPITLTSGMDVFNNTDLSKCTLYVPYLSKPNFINAEQWKSFSNIIENPNGICLDASVLKISETKNSTAGFKIKSNTSWTIISDQPWLKINKLTGANNDSITLIADANDSIGSRNALITIIDSNNSPQVISVIQDATLKVVNTSPGSLITALPVNQKKIVLKLKLIGTIDARDFKIIRDSLPLLTELDLGDVSIEAYSGNKGTYVEYTWSYAANEIPINSFYTNYGPASKTSLKSIKLPRYLNSINGSAFAHCTGLTEIFIPKSVKNISCNAFIGCLGLKQITMNNRTPLSTESCGDYYRPFGIVDTTACKLIVPYQTKLLYSSAIHWKNFRNIEECPYYLFLSSDTLNFTIQTGNMIKYPIQSNVSWNANSNQSWISFKTNTGSNKDSLIIIAEPNPSFAPRTAYVYINSVELEQEYIKIVQDGKDVVVNLTPGTLKNAILSSDKKNITSLTLTGVMDARDFQVLRDSMPKLSILDLSSVKIAAFSGKGGTYYTPTSSYNYPANEIPYSAFFDSYNYVGRPNLSKITIPKSLRSIGTDAFRRCAGLKTIVFNDTINTIKDYAFKDCISLRIGEIPNTITTIGERIYEGCKGIYLAKYLAPLKSTGINTFRDCIQLKEIVFSNSIETIGESCFHGCKMLSKVDFPVTIKTIGKSAFYDCSGLTNVAFSNNITSIGDIAFVNCTGITSILLPNSIKLIGNQSFSRCSNLDNIQLSTSLTSIGKSCFENCSKLTTIQLPQSLTYLGEAAFYFTGLKSIIIPESITVIQPSTFQGCNSLTNVVLPNMLTRIDNSAFDGCRYLPLITIPNSVTYIGVATFQSCENLRTINCKSTHPISFNNSSYVFNGVDKTNCVLNVNYKTKALYQVALEWKDFKNIVEKTQGFFINSEKIYFEAINDVSKKINIDTNVSWEIRNSFSWINAIKENVNGQESVVISVLNNTSLVKREGYIEILGADGEFYKIRVFQDAALITINCTAGSLNTEFTVLEKKQVLYLKLTGTIDARDFKIIRDSLVNLETLDISEVTIAQYADFVELDPDRWGLSYTYYAATIPANSFYYKTKLTSVILPNSITKIEKRSFYGCDNLKSITIPDNVTAIDTYAFYYCDSLKTVSLGKAVTAIGSNCFAFCYAINKITAKNTVPVTLSASSSVFYGVNNSSCYLFVPNGTATAYKAATVWKDFLNISAITTGVQSINQNNILVISERGKLKILNTELGGVAQIYSISGVKIKEQTILSDQTDIFLPTGVYVLRIGNFADKVLIK